ncbi:MAG TPA: gephyrin-like molybdotransferase Glp [Terriglobales bacterium]|nr:gephyrin-like molybdotransferase Glp [Terriglobales bacterium]
MPSGGVPEKILSFEDARHLVQHQAQGLRPPGKELVELLDGLGLVLAEPVIADRQLPPFPRATRDGYAVRSDDVTVVPARLRVIGEIKAGASSTVKLGRGEAIAIMTGAAAPDGSDAVVMIEHSSRTGDGVEIRKGVAAGENIIPAGSEARRGDRLLSPGMRLDYAAIAVAASVGKSHLLAYTKPRVAVLATGDELVDIDVPPAAHQIRNSNTYSLAAQISAAGAEPVLLPIAPDDSERLRELIDEGFEADLLLLAGGVSMGKYDLVEQVLADGGAEFFFTGAQIQPGKPIVFGQVGSRSTPDTQRYFFGLPGNPVSTMVTFELFVRPMLEALAGMASRKLMFLHAKLKTEIRTKTGLTRFLPAVLCGEFEQPEVELIRWQGSGDIVAVARANCYVVVAPHRERIAAGEWVPILMK